MLTYAVRHAESLTNAGQDSGLNAELSALGKRQVEALVGRFASTRLSAIYSAPFLRSIQTAIPIAQALSLPVRLRPELCEHHHLEPGTPVKLNLDAIDAIVRRHPGVIPCPDHRGPFVWAPADEPTPEVIARTRSFAAFLKNRWQDPADTAMLISHGSPVARLVEAWLTDQPGPWLRFVIENAAVTALRYHEGVSSLLCLNERSHLRGLPVPRKANLRDDGSVNPAPASPKQ